MKTSEQILRQRSAANGAGLLVTTFQNAVDYGEIKRLEGFIEAVNYVINDGKVLSLKDAGELCGTYVCSNSARERLAQAYRELGEKMQKLSL
jgi:hypothetical protein